MLPRDCVDFSTSRAILVGTAKYSVGFGKAAMPAAANSLAAMRTALTGLCGWPEARITQFADQGVSDGLLQKIAPLIHSATDVLLFYYVGHGQLLVGNDLGLALTDTSEEPRLRLSTSLRLSHLRQELEHNCDARIRIIILDCCCAGIAVKYSQGGANLAEQVHQAASLDGEGTYTWTACGHAQDAFYEPGASGKTYFTRFLTETVRDGVTGRAEGLTIAAVHREVTRRFRAAEIEGAPVKPEPKLLFRGAVDEFVFAENVAASVAVSTPQEEEIARLRQELDALRSTQAQKRVGAGRTSDTTASWFGLDQRANVQNEPGSSAAEHAQAQQQPPVPDPDTGARKLLTAHDVREKAFTTVRLREGYDENEVDDFLDKIESELLDHERGLPPGLTSVTPEQVRTQQFVVTTPGMSEGYDEEEVDAFLDEIELTLRRYIEGAQPPAR
jgi:DivIVA domain-containing protein